MHGVAPLSKNCEHLYQNCTKTGSCDGPQTHILPWFMIDLPSALLMTATYYRARRYVGRTLTALR